MKAAKKAAHNIDKLDVIEPHDPGGAESSVRRTETPRGWFRSQRVFEYAPYKWYFHTREGVQLGPYDSEAEAEVDATLLKELLKNHQGNSIAMSIIREFVLESYDLGRRLELHYREESADQAG